MNIVTIKDDANRNLARLVANTRIGRGIVVGLTPDRRHAVEICWGGGRSDDSRNRRYKLFEHNRVSTDVANENHPPRNPALTIYNAMGAWDHRTATDGEGYFIVSNGDQTDTVAVEPPTYSSFVGALSTRTYEPDGPTNTPRITGACRLHIGKDMEIYMSILRRATTGDVCEHTTLLDNTFVENRVAAGYCYCLHTYEEDGTPIPSYRGSPFLVPTMGNGIKEVLNAWWDTIKRPDVVMLAVKFINVRTGKSTVMLKNSQRKIRAKTKTPA